MWVSVCGAGVRGVARVLVYSHVRDVLDTRKCPIDVFPFISIFFYLYDLCYLCDLCYLYDLCCIHDVCDPCISHAHVHACFFFHLRIYTCIFSIYISCEAACGNKKNINMMGQPDSELA